MKIKNELHDKLLSGLKLVQASGKMEIGFIEAKKAVMDINPRAKYLFIACDICPRLNKAFKIPDKPTYTRKELEDVLKGYAKHISRLKKKKPFDLKKEVSILKVYCEEKKIPVFEGIPQKKLGQTVSAQSGMTSTIAITDASRADNIFKDVIKESSQ